MFFRLNMATGGGGGGGGGGDGDNLADFFDFSKPWVRRERMVPSAPRMVEVDRAFAKRLKTTHAIYLHVTSVVHK